MKNTIILNKKELHPHCVTVCCSIIMHHRIVCPYFVENAEGLTFLRTVVIYLRNCHELWLQQDGATCHISDETIGVLQGMFDNKIIYCRAALTWSQRSTNLNAPNHYLLGYIYIYIRKCLHQ